MARGFLTNQAANRCRTLRLEPLEARHLLSANPLVAAPVNFGEADATPAVTRSIVDNSLDARNQALAISAIHLRAGGNDVTVSSLNELVKVDIGDTLQVIGIDYRLNNGAVVSGKIAFEGYLNSLKGSKVKTDYSDGRFGRHEQEGLLPEGSASHSGLEGGWKMQAGTESLTLVMVRYDESGATVEDRVNLRTQVGTPDFAISPRVILRGGGSELVAGKQTRIYGTWANLGEGRFRNYAEVDIYHESDPTKIVWAGTLSKTLGAKQAVIGEFRNASSDEQFSKRWTPELAGTYIIKMYADPEQNWQESDEGNNVVTVKVTVAAEKIRGSNAFKHRAIADPPQPAAVNIAGYEARQDSRVTPIDASGLHQSELGRFATVTAEAPTHVAADNKTQREDQPAVSDGARELTGGLHWTAIDLALAELTLK